MERVEALRGLVLLVLDLGSGAFLPGVRFSAGDVRLLAGALFGRAGLPIGGRPRLARAGGACDQQDQRNDDE